MQGGGGGEEVKNLSMGICDGAPWTAHSSCIYLYGKRVKRRTDISPPQTLIFDLFLTTVTLKIRPKSPKPNQVFIMPQCYFHVNFVPGSSQKQYVPLPSPLVPVNNYGGSVISFGSL